MTFELLRLKLCTVANESKYAVRTNDFDVHIMAVFAVRVRAIPDAGSICCACAGFVVEVVVGVVDLPVYGKGACIGDIMVSEVGRWRSSSYWDRKEAILVPGRSLISSNSSASMYPIHLRRWPKRAWHWV